MYFNYLYFNYFTTLLVPNTNSYPDQLVPTTNSYPNHVVPNTNSYPTSLCTLQNVVRTHASEKSES